MRKDYKYIYGPVASWRLGASLGVDPISRKDKVCTFDCVYCQIGATKVFSDKREIFVSLEEIIKEIKSLPPLKIDYITFSGRGEPTLAKNLGEMIRGIKKLRKEKTAIITNTSLIDRKDVQRDLGPSDFVMFKLDAPSDGLFKRINRPMPDIEFDRILRGIKEFRGGYKGKIALQIMFIEENKKYAKEMAWLAKEVNPDEIQINTPLRPCGVRPLTKKEMDEIKIHFEAMNFISVYDSERRDVEPVSKTATLKRRGKI